MDNYTNKYFRICVPRGHVGNGRYSEIVFYIKADNMSSAIDKAIRMPSVKHNRYAFNAVEITKKEYIDGRKISAYERDGF